ncbi:hypothetical protein BV25DRAFT_766679 [Artomyces pyxidatus]|uniref:Uncharacterized protein n=1 Tax=Artomyces pyxidatus TaxID=48021 RepID=A0ACB8SZC1_9AGAM|nr:hypothetical protein BV25DRAFT_766679 [Artomyces pyxidatus]
MKCAILTLLASLAAAGSAQNINIGWPAAGSSVAPGTNITVQVNRPNSLTPSQEIALVVSIVGCNDRQGGCNDLSEHLGTTLYAGGFDPQYPTQWSPLDEPQQNFSVAVPQTLAAGPAVLSVVHFSLVGAGSYPLFEIKNTTLNVV